jgi:hypothetical protein
VKNAEKCLQIKQFPLPLNYLTSSTATMTMLRHGLCANLYFVTLLKFFYIAAAPLCLTREIARQDTAGRR